MKRQANLFVFLFFGLVSEAITLYLLGVQDFGRHAFSFLAAANAFLAYRILIENKRLEEKNYFSKSLRKWWIRSEPENSFAFAFFGAAILLVCNFGFIGFFDARDVLIYGFLAVGLTHTLFEVFRVEFNKISSYLRVKYRKWRVERNTTRLEVKKAYGLSKASN